MASLDFSPLSLDGRSQHRSSSVNHLLFILFFILSLLKSVRFGKLPCRFFFYMSPPPPPPPPSSSPPLRVFSLFVSCTFATDFLHFQSSCLVADAISACDFISQWILSRFSEWAKQSGSIRSVWFSIL